MSNPLIEYLSFRPVKRNRSLIGFCGFRWNREITFSEVGVHSILNPKDYKVVRLLYPKEMRPSKDMQVVIDQEINAYIVANYPEAIK